MAIRPESSFSNLLKRVWPHIVRNSRSRSPESLLGANLKPISPPMPRLGSTFFSSQSFLNSFDHSSSLPLKP